MRLLDKNFFNDAISRRSVAIGINVIAAGLLTILGIYVFESYGFALFILTPLLLGAGPVIVLGLKSEFTKRESWQIGLTALGVYSIGLIVFAIEGIICIVMAAPIAVFLTWIGSLVGYAIVNKTPKNAPTAMLILIGSIPTLSFMEKDIAPILTSVTTSIEIKADAKVVWNNVIEFPYMEEPTEFIFKTGIAYPVNAKIDGVGVGAMRHCNFTTGSFTEPITVWDEERLLKFDVAEQPAPMKELSFWDIDAPHLHDFFVSKKGQFKLIELPNGNTRLEGTTWYYHNIRPAFYWRFWSEYIVHKIHERVLTHIKKNSEQQAN